MAVIKKIKIKKIKTMKKQGCGEREASFTVGGIVWCSHYGNNMDIPQKIINGITIKLSNSTFGHLSKGNENTNLKRCIHHYTRCGIIYDSQIWKQCKCPLTDVWINCGIYIQWNITQL